MLTRPHMRSRASSGIILEDEKVFRSTPAVYHYQTPLKAFSLYSELLKLENFHIPDILLVENHLPVKVDYHTLKSEKVKT